MRSSCKVNLVGVDGLLRLDGSHGNYVIYLDYLLKEVTAPNLLAIALTPTDRLDKSNLENSEDNLNNKLA